MASSSTDNRYAMRLTATLGIAVSLFAAAPVMAQAAQARQWLVSPRAGIMKYERGAAIRPAPFLGVDATYYITPMFGIGPSITIARSKTNGDDFITALNFGIPSDGDTTLYFGVTQPVTTFDANMLGTARMPFGRFTPFLVGGVGVYTLYLNPQLNGEARRLSNMSVTLGGGVDVVLGNSGSLQLSVRDLVLHNLRREFLNPADRRFVETRFAEDLPQPSEVETYPHNIQFSIGFSFRPGGNVAAGGESR